MFDEYGVAVPTTRAQSAALARAVARGKAHRIYRGIYVAAQNPLPTLTRIRAAQAWCPDAVLLGDSAAHLAHAGRWPVRTLELATARTRGPDGLRRVRVRVPPEWIVDSAPFRFTHPALTAAWLAGGHNGGDAVDFALRNGVSLTDIVRAAPPGWPGAVTRQRVLRESRDEPWSAPERAAHQLLRRARITGWKANTPIRTPGGDYFGDIVFKAPRLVLEIDGFAHHSSPASFTRDRRRQNDLVLAQWRVLRFAPAMVVDEPEQFIRTVRRALAA